MKKGKESNNAFLVIALVIGLVIGAGAFYVAFGGDLSLAGTVKTGVSQGQEFEAKGSQGSGCTQVRLCGVNKYCSEPCATVMPTVIPTNIGSTPNLQPYTVSTPPAFSSQYSWIINFYYDGGGKVLKVLDPKNLSKTIDYQLAAPVIKLNIIPSPIMHLFAYDPAAKGSAGFTTAEVYYGPNTTPVWMYWFKVGGQDRYLSSNSMDINGNKLNIRLASTARGDKAVYMKTKTVSNWPLNDYADINLVGGKFVFNNYCKVNNAYVYDTASEIFIDLTGYKINKFYYLSACDGNLMHELNPTEIIGISR